jgi:hypothetical protein
MSAPDTCAVCGNDFHFGHAYTPAAAPAAPDELERRCVLDFAAVCATCGCPQPGRLYLGATSAGTRLADVVGGRLDVDGWTCDGCVGGAE